LKGGDRVNAERSSLGCRSARLCLRMLAATVLVYFCASSALFAQSPKISDRLPQNTLFYLQWRGKSFLGDADKKNHVLQLLEDPDFEVLRQAFAKNLLQRQQKDGTPTPPVQLPDLISLLDNPGAAGLIASPTPVTSASPSDPSHLSSVFLVYDMTGKVDLVKKLKTAAESASKEKPKITTYEFGGTTIEVSVAGSNAANTGYSARSGNYFLVASQREVIEDLVTRFRTGSKPLASVTQLPEYQSVLPYIGSDAAVEYFGRIPDLDKWISPDQKDQPVVKFIRNLHLDKIHVAGGGISFAGEALHSRGALLGDTSSTSLFDIVGANSATFQMQQLVGPGPYFSIFRFNFPQLYQIIREAALATVTAQQAVGLTGAEAMAQGFLGMSITDALQLFTGEVGSQLSYTPDGESQQLYALAIQKPQDVLKLLRVAVSKIIAAEDTSADTTYLDLSYPIHDPVSGQERRNFYYLAVTPQFVIGGPSKGMVREAVARVSGKSGVSSVGLIFSNPDFIRLRALMPDKLIGIGGVDMTQIPWDKVINRYVQQMQQTEKLSKQKNASSTEWLQSLKPGMFTRHLRVVVNGWWKDSNGIYFDYYAQ